MTKHSVLPRLRRTTEWGRGAHEFVRRRRGKIESFDTFSASAVARDGLRGTGGPPLLSTFGSKQQAKFRFLGAADQARRVALVQSWKKRCSHLLQNCSTTLPLVQEAPNGVLNGANEFARGAKIPDFSAKSRVPVRDRQTEDRTLAAAPASRREFLIPCAGLPAPPTPMK